jgi:hypothetical protein
LRRPKLSPKEVKHLMKKKRGEVTGDVENCVMRSPMIHIPY